MLSMSLPHCQAKYIQNSREMERQGRWPISFHPLVFLSLFLFSSLALLFLLAAPKSLSAGLQPWQTLQYRARTISRPLFRRWWMLITVQYIVPMSDCLQYPKFQWIIPFLVTTIWIKNKTKLDNKGQTSLPHRLNKQNRIKAVYHEMLWLVQPKYVAVKCNKEHNAVWSGWGGGVCRGNCFHKSCMRKCPCWISNFLYLPVLHYVPTKTTDLNISPLTREQWINKLVLAMNVEWWRCSLVHSSGC